MEALICALYLDGGFKVARAFIMNFVFKDFKTQIQNNILIDYKSKLQELTQARYQKTPDYRIVREEGPDHEKIFSAEVYVEGKKVGFGKGQNKKEAQQNAAQKAIENNSDLTS